MSTHIFLDLFQDYRRYFLVLGDVLLDSKTSKVILSILRSTRLSKTMLFSDMFIVALSILKFIEYFLDPKIFPHVSFWRVNFFKV